jgi:hypothetical protein
MLADPDADDTPLWFVVDASQDIQPEHFEVAVGDAIEFHSSPGHVVLRIQGEPGVLGDLSVMRVARFGLGTPYIEGGGRKVQSIKAKKAGKAKVEVTTHRGGTRREIREFDITVVDKRKEKVPVMEKMPSYLYGPPVVGTPTSGPES